jgi:hypothetical protein
LESSELVRVVGFGISVRQWGSHTGQSLPIAGDLTHGSTEMKKYLVAAFLIAAFATPALAVDTGGGHYFVGIDTTSHKCSVVTEMAPGMKMMGEYDSKDAAEKAMASMADCKA